MSGPSPAPPGARAALTANNHPQSTQTLEDNLAAATAINAATQEAVELVQERGVPHPVRRPLTHPGQLTENPIPDDQQPQAETATNQCTLCGHDLSPAEAAHSEVHESCHRAFEEDQARQYLHAEYRAELARDALEERA